MLSILTIDIRVQVVADLVEDELDLDLCRRRVVSDGARAVCRTSHRHVLPGQEEDDAAITCSWIKQAHFGRAVGMKISWFVGWLCLTSLQHLMLYQDGH